MKRVSIKTYEQCIKYLDIEQARNKIQKWIKNGIVEKADKNLTAEKGMSTYIIHTYLDIDYKPPIDFHFTYDGTSVGWWEH